MTMKAPDKRAPLAWYEVLQREMDRMGRVNARKLANNTRVPETTVREWLAGERTPTRQEWKLIGLTVRAVVHYPPPEFGWVKPVPPPPRVPAPPPSNVVPIAARPPPSKETFSAALTRLREKEGLSKLALAQTLGCSDASVNNWEAGMSISRRWYDALCLILPELAQADASAQLVERPGPRGPRTVIDAADVPVPAVALPPHKRPLTAKLEDHLPDGAVLVPTRDELPVPPHVGTQAPAPFEAARPIDPWTTDVVMPSTKTTETDTPPVSHAGTVSAFASPPAEAPTEPGTPRGGDELATLVEKTTRLLERLHDRRHGLLLRPTKSGRWLCLAVCGWDGDADDDAPEELAHLLVATRAPRHQQIKDTPTEAVAAIYAQLLRAVDERAEGLRKQIAELESLKGGR